MTRKQFLTTLAKTARKWELRGTFIRYRGSSRCPIEQVGYMTLNRAIRADNALACSEALGIPPKLSADIMHAADGCEPPTLRHELLVACGLATP
jgi:hypothetical protein